MTILNTFLLGILAGLITFKIVLLAVAAVLFVYALTERRRQRALTPARAPVRHNRLDVHV
jgi:hypothetical protein